MQLHRPYEQLVADAALGNMRREGVKNQIHRFSLIPGFGS